MAGDVALRHSTRFRRWALRLFTNFLLLAVVTLIVIVATFADANADSPAMLVGAILATVSLPIWIATGVLAAISLVRREPRPLIAVGLIAICALLSFAIAPIGLDILRGAGEVLG